MKLPVYQELPTVMQSRRGPYAGLDIPEFYALVEELFTPEEAAVNNILARQPETLEQIALKSNCDPKGLLPFLEAMAGKGLCATFVIEDEHVFKASRSQPIN